MKKILEKKEIIIIIVLIIILITIPFIIGAMVKAHEWDKPISIDNWLIYYATIGGALIGGFITSVGLYITIKQTREIQSENKSIQEKSERKAFVNEIEDLVGKYIADIGTYFYAQTVRGKGKEVIIDRSKSIIYFRILKIKLAGIDDANTLMEIINNIHNRLCFFREGEDFNKKVRDIEDAFDNLSGETKKFGMRYIEANDNQ